jgi:anti-sigma factor RsiW
MTDRTPVTDAELHAYADGFLDHGDRQRVEAFLADNPDTAASVADWQTQNAEIRAAFAGYERSRPGDADLVMRRRRWRPSLAGRLAASAAAVAIFVLGAVAGHYGPQVMQSDDRASEGAELLPQEARSAYLVYANEVRHPVEVFADQEAHLATWLGKRLAIDDLKVPNLQPLGFRLVGGRLLPVGNKPGALFMYEDASGRRLTVLVGRNPENRDTSFRFASVDGLETFYWIDGALGYAVTGEISRDVLQKVAEECYRQFPS